MRQPVHVTCAEVIHCTVAAGCNTICVASKRGTCRISEGADTQLGRIIYMAVTRADDIVALFKRARVVYLSSVHL